jgi:hypothetical protein
MNSSNQVSDEFNTNIEILKITNKILHMNLTRDTNNLVGIFCTGKIQGG